MARRVGSAGSRILGSCKGITATAFVSTLYCDCSRTRASPSCAFSLPLCRRPAQADQSCQCRTEIGAKPGFPILPVPSLSKRRSSVLLRLRSHLPSARAPALYSPHICPIRRSTFGAPFWGRDPEPRQCRGPALCKRLLHVPRQFASKWF